LVDIRDKRPYTRGKSGRRRPAVYWLASASSRGSKTHAVIEGSDLTFCGREVEEELGDELIPGCGDEPNCRVCRREIRARARLLDPLSNQQRGERMACPRCGFGDFDLTIREVWVDRCSVFKEEDGALFYDVDDDPKRRVEDRRLRCRHCRSEWSETELISARDFWPERKPFDFAAFQAQRSAASAAATKSLAATVERLARPVVEDTPF
jgi:hypothetical protein